MGCESGFRVTKEACIAVKVPEKGYLTKFSDGSGWARDRGFPDADEVCIVMKVSEQVCFDYSGYHRQCVRHIAGSATRARSILKDFHKVRQRRVCGSTMADERRRRFPWLITAGSGPVAFFSCWSRVNDNIGTARAGNLPVVFG